MSEWQQIAQIPVDSGRLAVLDPSNAEDLLRHEEDQDPETSPTTYGLVSNGFGAAVALLLASGLGDGSYPVEARFEDVAGAVRIAEIRVRFLPHPVLGYALGGEA
jgi:hypothetical protein